MSPANCPRPLSSLPPLTINPKPAPCAPRLWNSPIGKLPPMPLTSMSMDEPGEEMIAVKRKTPALTADPRPFAQVN